ncbi:MAG: hypothetical protein ACFFD4_38285, partial [Candidatus Odinarchaeota archaeon]
NYIKNIGLKITIGLIITIEKDYAMVISGSLDNVKRQTGYFVTIKPSEDKKGVIAKRIKSEFTKMVSEEEKNLVERMDINEIVAFIP